MKHLSALFIFCVPGLFASGNQISGRVIDAETEEPLSYANIMVDGQNMGTISNADGQYVLDLGDLNPESLIVFSYVGYKTIKVKVKELQHKPTIQMHPAIIQLKTVEVTNKTLTAREIITLVNKNFRKNYPERSRKQQVFYHKYERVPFPEENKIELKSSDFVGLDRKTFNDIMHLMPREFIEYQDAIVDLYHLNEDHKLIPVKGISMEEGSQQMVYKELEKKLTRLFEDIERSRNDSDIYYQFRSGILRQKFEQNGENDSLWDENRKDTLNYTMDTDLVKNDILLLLKAYTDIKSKNWEFITQPHQYSYSKKEITIFNDELVYPIVFTPKKDGLFEGTMYVSANSYAVLQLDFEFAEGRQSEDFQLLGFGHSMNYKKGRVIFEKGKNGYTVKYIYAHQNESASINRKFSIVKRQKRFLADAELNEIKLEADINFTFDSYRELLVLETESINPDRFEKVHQPAWMKFRREFAYTPEMWSNETVIVPSAELKKYKRKD